MKISFVMVTLVGVPAVALATPTPALTTVTPRSAAGLAKRTKTVLFLDGVAASYRKLHSLSATWRRTGYDPAHGSFAWHHSKPAQVRFENQKDHLLFVSDGFRKHLTVAKDSITGVTIDRLWHADPTNPAEGVGDISCDGLTQFFLAGQNPLRASRWNTFSGMSADGEACLLGVATVNGVRCRGVEIRAVVEGRDASYTNIFTMWFDSRNLLRRSQEATVESGPGFVVDFEMHPNAKLSPSLFLIPNRPDGGN